MAASKAQRRWRGASSASIATATEAQAALPGVIGLNGLGAARFAWVVGLVERAAAGAAPAGEYDRPGRDRWR